MTIVSSQAAPMPKKMIDRVALNINMVNEVNGEASNSGQSGAQYGETMANARPLGDAAGIGGVG